MYPVDRETTRTQTSDDNTMEALDVRDDDTFNLLIFRLIATRCHSQTNHRATRTQTSNDNTMEALDDRDDDTFNLLKGHVNAVGALALFELNEDEEGQAIDHRKKPEQNVGPLITAVPWRGSNGFCPIYTRMTGQRQHNNTNEQRQPERHDNTTT